jgi:hypothetical protein
LEFSGAPGVVEGALGGVLVSILELGEDIGVPAFEAVPAFVSVLLEDWGSGVPLDGPALGELGVMPGAGEFAAVVSVVAGAGVVTILVGAVLEVVLSLSRLQPVSADAMTRMEATKVNAEAEASADTGVEEFIPNSLAVLVPREA